MFVRFRKSARRLDLNVVETRRHGPKVRHEHIASLGSCPVEPSIADRIALWRRLFDRLDKLSNRIGDEDRLKIFDAVQAKFPMPTPEERRALQLENADDASRLWTLVRDHNGAEVEAIAGWRRRLRTPSLV